MIHSIYLHLWLRQGGHVVCIFENICSFLLIPLLMLHGHVSTDPTMDSQKGEEIISPKKKKSFQGSKFSHWFFIGCLICIKHKSCLIKYSL